ncbi:MAG: 50S ribosomal protein L6 [Candidatus Sericytochromatia bacterium]
MSRIGRKLIVLGKASVEINGRQITVKGPQGQLQREIPALISIENNEGILQVTRANDSKQARALHGLVRSLVANMVEGVNNGYAKTLELIGVGYKASLKSPTELVLNVGYSHPVEFTAPQGITFELEGTTKVLVKGIDKEAVGNLSAKIRAVRKPEPYKGKGIKYGGEVIRRKAGKAK